jgi:ferredoxin
MMILWVDGLCLLAASLFFVMLGATSWREGEKRAVGMSLLLLLGNGLLWGVLMRQRRVAAVQAGNVLLLGLLLIFIVLSLLKYFPARPLPPDGMNVERFDERDHMFSRNQLKFHPDLAGSYYARNPDFRPMDEKIHSRPELGMPGHVYYDELYSPAFAAAFAYLERTRAAAGGQVSPRRSEAGNSEIQSAIARLARYYGAVDVGFARLQPHHFYSHGGRRAEGWGDPIAAGHGSAVVLVVAMDWKMIAQAPSLPAILESSRQYVEAAKIAMVVAEYIRGLGYPARAHTDGNYQVLCVPLAIDAGLGELGRLGLLIHPVYGPCVRLAAVTTELELPPGERKTFHAASFCRICMKCADNCPTRSIPAGKEPSSRNVRHWSITQESCFAFWKQMGSDCAVCIRACPYTKPDSLLHRLVRFYVSRNPLNQRLALFLDDLFYGRKKKLSAKNPREVIPGIGRRGAGF